MAEKLPEIQSLDSLIKDALDAMKLSVDKRQKLDPGKSLVEVKPEVKEKYEAPKSIWSANFDLGKYLGGEGDAPGPVDIKKDNAVYVLAGEVDRKVFDKNRKREDVVVYTDDSNNDVKWYQDVQQTAANFLKWQDKIEAAFTSMQDGAAKTKMLGIIKVMSAMTDFTDAGWKKMIADNGYSDDDIYGAEGAYNLLLSFNRATAKFNLDKNGKGSVVVGKDKDQKVVSIDKVYKIHLAVAKQPGDRRQNRSGRIIEIGVKEEKKVEPVKKPPEPVKKPPEPVKKPPEPVKKPPEPVKKPPEPVKKPPEPVKQPEPVKEGPKEKLQLMIKELEANKFKLVEKPTDFNTNAYYAKYGEKRVNIWFNSDGTYAYRVVSIVKGGATKYEGGPRTLPVMKGEIDKIPDGHNDYVGALQMDLQKMPGFKNATLTGPLDKDAEGDAYDENTYKVVVPDFNFNDSKNVPAKVKIEFVVTISAKNGYTVIESDYGRISKTEDAAELYKDIVEKVKDKIDKERGN